MNTKNKNAMNMKNKVISLFCLGILACSFFHNRNYATANNEMQLNDSIGDF